MAKLRLHLDADTSIRALHQALLGRGHDVTRTPAEWIALDAGDEEQLLGATLHGRCIFTFNIRDFTVLAGKYPQHAGIILATQSRWTLGELIRALDRVLSETGDAEWMRQIRWLNQWRH